MCSYFQVLFYSKIQALYKCNTHQLKRQVKKSVKRTLKINANITVIQGNTQIHYHVV